MLDDFEHNRMSLMKSGFANKAQCANTPEQTALMPRAIYSNDPWQNVNTWRLSLNSWPLDSRMLGFFVHLEMPYIISPLTDYCQPTHSTADNHRKGLSTE